MDGGDPREIERAAHRVKGSLLVMAAGPAAEVALALEALGRSGETADAGSTLARLEQEIDRLMPEMAKLADGDQLDPYGER